MVEGITMGDSKLCTRDRNINKFEVMAEKDHTPGKNGFYDELWNFLAPKSEDDQYFFMDGLRNCIEAEKQLHPKLDLPKFDWVARPREIV
jgi:hypothetical protein